MRHELVLSLTTEERRELEALTRSRSAAAADVKRARLIMMLDEGLSWSAISARLPVRPTTSVAGRAVSRPNGWADSTPDIEAAPR